MKRITNSINKKNEGLSILNGEVQAHYKFYLKDLTTFEVECVKEGPSFNILLLIALKQHPYINKVVYKGKEYHYPSAPLTLTPIKDIQITTAASLIDPERVKELTFVKSSADVIVPVIGNLLVDGNHRITRAKQLGIKEVYTYQYNFRMR